jgi:hypothetical protein
VGIDGESELADAQAIETAADHQQVRAIVTDLDHLARRDGVASDRLTER